MAIDPERLSDLPRLPRDEGGPVFAEPWQAQAFALAVKLSEQGHFTWREWAATLAEELKAASDRGEPDDGSHYYEHWLAALERLVEVEAAGQLIRPAPEEGRVGGCLPSHAARQAGRAPPPLVVTDARPDHRRPSVSRPRRLFMFRALPLRWRAER